MYNYAKLNGKIVEVCGTQAKFAEKMNLSNRTMSLKLNNKVAFKQDEIKRAAEILGIGDNEISLYFFTLNVQSC